MTSSCARFKLEDPPRLELERLPPEGVKDFGSKTKTEAGLEVVLRLASKIFQGPAEEVG